jgi:hypothetical protein
VYSSSFFFLVPVTLFVVHCSFSGSPAALSAFLTLYRAQADDQEMLCGKEIPRFNEAALSSVLSDVKFIEAEIKRLEKPALDNVFDEVKLVSDEVQFQVQARPRPGQGPGCTSPNANHRLSISSCPTP